MPAISVVLTSYNHAQYLSQSIESILAQTYSNFELIIVDDCSQDNSWEIINSYKDERIMATRLESNTYCSYLSSAVLSSSGEYVAIAHCDDVWMPNKLEKQLAFLEANSNIAACFTMAEIIDENSKPFKEGTHYFDKKFNRENRTRFEWLHEFYYNDGGLCHPSILIRKSAYTEYGLSSRGLSSIPDFRQWIKLCSNAEIYIYPEKLTQFRVRRDGKNTSGDRAEIHYRNATELYLVLREFLLIDKPEDFVKVFPETRKYLINGEMVIPFAFAQMILHTDKRPMHILFALQQIYDIMQDKLLLKKVETLYGYSERDFALEKLKWDVFSQIPNNRFLSCRLYADFGSGFQDENSIPIKKVYVNNDNEFLVEISLNELCKGKPIKALRFDPDDEQYRVFSEMQFTLENKKLQVLKTNAELIDNKDWFYTIDSQYYLDCTENEGVLVVRGKTKLIPLSDVDFFISKRYNILYEEKARQSKEFEDTENQKKYIALHDDYIALIQSLKNNRLKSIIKIILNKNFYHNS